MAIDASIPLQARGVQLESPANQLNMMASAARLGEYQRGVEEKNALRGLMSSGIDIKSPEALRQMYAISPEIGMNFEKRQAELGKISQEGKKLGFEIDDKKLALMREATASLSVNPSKENIAAYLQDSVLKGYISNEEAAKQYAQYTSVPMNQRSAYFTNLGLKNEERVRNQTTMRGQNITAGTAANRLEFDRQQAQNPEMQLVQMEDGSYAGVNKRTGQAMPITMGQPPVNALAPSAPTQGDESNMLAPTVAPTTAPAPQPLRGKPIIPPFESEYSKVVGKAVAERQVSQVKAAESAVDNILKINDTLTQLKDSDAITGFGAELFTNVERVKTKFLNDKAAGKKVTDTEVLDAMLGSDVFPMIQSLGIGARGLDTIQEREYLRSVMTGTITMNKDALIEITQIRLNIAERAINKYNEKVDKGEFNKYFEAQGVAPRRIEMPNKQKTIVKTGTYEDGRKVIKYSDGTVEYEN